MKECSIKSQVEVKHYGADGEAVESLCSEQESSEQVAFYKKVVPFLAKTFLVL